MSRSPNSKSESWDVVEGSSTQSGCDNKRRARIALIQRNIDEGMIKVPADERLRRLQERQTRMRIGTRGSQHEEDSSRLDSSPFMGRVPPGTACVRLPGRGDASLPRCRAARGEGPRGAAA